MNTKLHVIAALIFALIAIVIIACTKTSSTPPLLITSPMIDNQDSTEIDSDLASMVDIVRTFTQSFVNSNVDTATFVELAQAGDFVEYYRLLGIDSTEAAQMTANFINHLNSFKVRYNVGNDTCSTCLNHTDTSEVIHGTAKILQLFKDNPNIGSEFFSLYLGDEIVHLS